MALRFMLSNEFHGTLVIDHADPIGLSEITKTIKRSATYEGAVFEIIFDVDFIKKGRRFLKQCFELYGGLDALVVVKLYYRDYNARRWKIYATGKVNYNKYDVYEDKLTVTLEQTGMQTAILNLIERSVDLETLTSEKGFALPPTPVFDMSYHSKSILKTTIGYPARDGDNPYVEQQFLDQGGFLVPATGTNYREINFFVQASTERLDPEELTKVFQSTEFAFHDYDVRFPDNGAATIAETKSFLMRSDVAPQRIPVAVLQEGGSLKDISVSLGMKLYVGASSIDDVDVCGDGNLGASEFTWWLEVRDNDDNIVYLENIGAWSLPGCGGSERESGQETHSLNPPDITVERGWTVFVFGNHRIYGDYSIPGIGGSASVNHNFRITPNDDYAIKLSQQTETASSTAKTMFLHDAIEKWCMYATNQTVAFKSNMLGRVERGYAEDGPGAFITITNGKNLRGTDAQIFGDFKSLYDYVNQVLCCGFSFETLEDGTMIMRLEKRDFFYSDDVVLDLGKVSSVRKSIRSKDYYNAIEFGYSTKLDIGQVNAVDEFNTKRTFSTPIVNTKNTVKMSVPMITGGYQIESQRRKAGTTEDSKLDDANFSVVCIRTAPGVFESKKDQGYEYINNFLDPSTGYNFDISPVSCLRNWFTEIASLLIYSQSKTISFLNGEVNFLVEMKKTGDDFIVKENGVYDLTEVKPRYDNFDYIFDGPLRDSLFIFLNEHPYGTIKFEDQFGEKFEAYLGDGSGVEHSNYKGIATFKLRKKFNPTI